MSAYETLMLGMEAANTVNVRRTRAVVEELAAHHANAEVRRAHIEALRNTVFDAAKVVSRAADVLPQSAPAAYYLALRSAPVLGPEGIPDSAFPDFGDKSFHHQAAAQLAAVSQAARSQLDASTTGGVERVVWLESVIPLLRSYLTWSEIQSLIRGGERSFNTMPAFGIGRFLIAMMGAGLLMQITGRFFLPFLLAGAGYALWTYRVGARTRAVTEEAQQIAARGGEAFALGTTDDQVRTYVEQLTTTLSQSGITVDPARPENTRSTLDQLSAEFGAIWGRLFPGSGAHTSQWSLPA